MLLFCQWLEPIAIGLGKSRFTSWAGEEPKSYRIAWRMSNKMAVLLGRRVAVG